MGYTLDKPHQLELTKAKKMLAELDDLCRRAGNCGFDMSAQDAAAQALRAKIDAIQREFTVRRTE